MTENTNKNNILLNFARASFAALLFISVFMVACPRASIQAYRACETHKDCASWQRCVDNQCTPELWPEDAGPVDASGHKDAGAVDARNRDALLADATAADLQQTDAARPDTQRADSNMPDANLPDSAQPDTYQAPTLSFEYIETINIAQRQVTVHAGYNMNAQSQVEYGTSTAYGTWGPKESTFNWSEMFHDLTGLTPGTLYHFRVHGWDPDGHEIISADQTFSTTSMCDNYPASNGLIAPGSAIRNYQYHDKDGHAHWLCELADGPQKLLYIVLSGFT